MTVVQPMDNFVLLEMKTDENTVTELGLILPANVEPEKALVKSIGCKCTFVKVGDIAYFGKYAGDEMEIDGKKYMFIRESEVLAVKRD
jgi:chaperonin GroES